ncbi:MAG: hypothetical protein LBC25_02125, partial [Holosporales bacterium]|nr:hypothetical protein [Holosporales bacterium]
MAIITNRKFSVVWIFRIQVVMAVMVSPSFSSTSIDQGNVTGTTVISGMPNQGQNILVPAPGSPIQPPPGQPPAPAEIQAVPPISPSFVDLNGNVFVPPPTITIPLQQGIYIATDDPTNPEIKRKLDLINAALHPSSVNGQNQGVQTVGPDGQTVLTGNQPGVPAPGVQTVGPDGQPVLTGS